MRLPDVGLVTVVDTETQRRRMVDTARREIRLAFAAEADRRRTAVAGSLDRAGAAHLRLWTDRDWVRPLVRFMEQRRRVRASGRAIPFIDGDDR